MNLQNFVTHVIEAIGGIVEPLEYALCHVLVPEEYKDYFQGRTDFLLSFDFEVAEENPESEFITFGSYILDQLINIIKEKTISDVRYAVIDRLYLANPLEKIKKYFNINRGSAKIIEEKKVMEAFALFNFKAGYTTDERIEENIEIWVKMDDNTIADDMKESKDKLYCKGSPLYTYPVIKEFSVIDSFNKAYCELVKYIDAKKKQYKNSVVLKNELGRIDEYYEELLMENERKMYRKGITHEKIDELKSKANALKLEKQRQQKEINEKYSVITDEALENGILYFVPVIEYTMNFDINHKQFTAVVYYNAVTQNFYSNFKF